MGIHQSIFILDGTSPAVPNTADNLWASNYNNFGIAEAIFTFGTNGTTAFSGINSGNGTNPNWYKQTTTNIGNSYWIRATSVSEAGGSRTGTMNTWLALSSNRTWALSSNGDPDAQWTVLMEFATDSSGTQIVGRGGLIFFTVDTSA